MVLICGWSFVGRIFILEFCLVCVNWLCIRMLCNIIWNDCVSNVVIYIWFISLMEYVLLKIIRVFFVCLNILIKSMVGFIVWRVLRVKNGGLIIMLWERIKVVWDLVVCFIGGSSLDLMFDWDMGILNGFCWRNLVIIFLI